MRRGVRAGADPGAPGPGLIRSSRGSVEVRQRDHGDRGLDGGRVGLLVFFFFNAVNSGMHVQRRNDARREAHIKHKEKE